MQPALRRPGDTIVLLPGEEHDVSDVVVPFPLHIMGGGSAPEQTLLTCARGADTALDFRCVAGVIIFASGRLSWWPYHLFNLTTRSPCRAPARRLLNLTICSSRSGQPHPSRTSVCRCRASAGRLFNLTIRSPRGACVTHRCGKLSIERCCLRSDHPPFLDHLVSAIVTLAAGPQQAQPVGKPAATAGGTNMVQEAGGGAVTPLPLPAPSCPSVGPGVLSVVESEIQVSSLFLLPLFLIAYLVVDPAFCLFERGLMATGRAGRAALLSSNPRPGQSWDGLRRWVARAFSCVFEWVVGPSGPILHLALPTTEHPSPDTSPTEACKAARTSVPQFLSH